MLIARVLVDITAVAFCHAERLRTVMHRPQQVLRLNVQYQPLLAPHLPHRRAHVPCRIRLVVAYRQRRVVVPVHRQRPVLWQVGS